jgi:hypothetical protein
MRNNVELLATAVVMLLIYAALVLAAHHVFDR